MIDFIRDKARLYLFILIFLLLTLSGAFSQGTDQASGDLMWLPWIGSIIALIFAGILVSYILRQDQGNKRMREISRYVQIGALAYLKQQYKVVGIFFLVLFIVLSVISFGFRFLSPFVPFAFITGGFFSGLAGFIGMVVATKSNARTAAAAQNSLNAGLRVAFCSGTVMGMVVVGLVLLDLAIWWTVLRFAFKLPVAEIPPIMITFGMGASSMALFARLGGGIFTKAADVGADLVGKVEAGIPEDDPRNPATVADNVGDNVGDVAGMGADLYESYAGSIIATMALGTVASFRVAGIAPVQAAQIPVTIATIGVICSILGTFLVRSREESSQKELLVAVRKGTYIATILTAVASFFLIYLTVGLRFFGIWLSVVIGLIAGNVIGYFTEYFTSDNYRPTQDLSNEALTGPATVVIGGLALGMVSTVVPVVTVVTATLSAFFLSGGFYSPGLGLYGVGLLAVGMLSTLGITLASDAYGPVADNAGGIAEMSHLEPVVRERTDALDALGNTTAATGKGFAIGSAALTALALLASYGNKIVESLQKVGFSEAFKKFYAGLIDLDSLSAEADISILTINILNPTILTGLFLGVMIPVVFASMSMKAVGKAAGEIVQEVRRQFRTKRGILQGTEQPDYAACVTIATKRAQREMVLPSLLALIGPCTVGILFGPFAVLSLLAGALCSGFILAVLMANAGGAWDNAKKLIEKGKHGGKGTDAHRAAVVGDTIGDPLKDTSGPSMNILIKLMSMVSIVFVPVLIAINNLIIPLFM
jgi:K(+)-stimulated pyrophosphate-energized sodium pump